MYPVGNDISDFTQKFDVHSIKPLPVVMTVFFFFRILWLTIDKYM